MVGEVLQQGAVISCPHGGVVLSVPGETRVTVAGAPVLVATDTFLVTGCPHQVPSGAGSTPQPCVRVLWTAPAGRVLVQGAPVVLSWSTGICLSVGQIPQGAPIVASVQQRVAAQ